MTDTPPDPNKKGQTKDWIMFAVVFGGTYAMNQFSLHGVDFKVFGVSSEIVKSLIEASLLRFLSWVTPDHVVDSIVFSLRWMRFSARKIWGAATGPLQAMMNKPD